MARSNSGVITSDSPGRWSCRQSTTDPTIRSPAGESARPILACRRIEDRHLTSADTRGTIMSLTPTPARTPVLTTGAAEAKREEIRRYFHDTYDVYEKLFEVMTADEAYYRRADPLRHPLIFYLG